MMKRNFLFALVILFNAVFLQVPTSTAQDFDAIPRVTAMAWHPNLPFIAVANRDRFFLANEHFEPLRQPVEREGITQVAWSHNGRYLVTNAPHVDEFGRTRRSQLACRIEVWRLDADGQSLASVFSLPICAPSSIEWSADDAWIAVRDSYASLYVISMTDGSIQRLIIGDKLRYRRGAFTLRFNWSWQPNGNHLAIIFSDASLRLYNPREQRFTVEIPRAGTQVEWSPDGSRIVTLWNLGAYTFPAIHEGGEYKMRWYDRLALRFWNPVTGWQEMLVDIGDDSTWLKNLVWLPKNRLAGNCIGWTVDFNSDGLCVWNLDTGQLIHSYFLAGGSSSASDAFWSPMSDAFAIEKYWHGGWVEVFTIGQRYDEKIRMEGHAPVWSPDGRYVDTRSGCKIYRLDRQSGTISMYSGCR